MVTTLGQKMAAEWNGVAGFSGSGPGPSQWRWSRSLWVQGVLLLLGGLWASSTSIPVSLDSSPPCRHHVPSETEVINKVHLKANHVVKRDVDEHLRIKTVYDKSIDELLPEKRYLVKNKLFPQAISYLEKTFQVRRPAGTILLSRQRATNRYLQKENDPHRYCTGEFAEHTKCGPVIVPEEHLQRCRVCRGGKWSCVTVGVQDQEGVRDADFVLYVGALATERCSHENIISYAAYCQQEAKMDRPIAGYANLCPNMISTQPQEFIGMLSTVKHEIIHALGFSAGLFAFYHDKDGNPLTSRFADGLPPFNYSLGLYQWSDKVVRKVERLWNVRDNKIISHTVYLLVTPRVVDEARKHFNCPILEGMELENQGGMGTELNHWEKRLLENEAMTGSHTQNRVFSRITLALMEDTGWYKANYSMAEKLDWGRGMGCDFVRKSCKFWIDQQKQKRQTLSPFCDTLRSNPLQLTCRQDQRAVAVCNLQKFSKPLPPEYQYFDELSGIPTEDLPYYGGSVEIADYCPFSQEFSWHLSGEYQRSSDCRILENQPDLFKNYGAEKYGPHSVCLIQKSAFVMEKCERKLSYPDWGSGCYQVSCSPQGLTVWVQNTSYLCSRAGQVLPVSIQMNGWIHDGNLLCPSCWDFCELCPPERDPPATNLTRALPLDLCSHSSSLVVTLWLLLGNLFPLLAGFLLCVWH
ncbi:leishmanolysin-like peptidase [Mustela nigripes]|uniref:Leishmanolysin-like peptidase n=1 Tax=Mustela putorius furo TaxID=9669 RepID=M3XYE5_MUSPF|nr:leishmanolysin-like peptidase isoform X2 [Mustela putorius furo]XP_059018953.1 leishmanolysin-like peptidase isoform X1 [Mustela lutreola]XP_059247115.1 leishmanolysin-like peptidase [Mustela nigripes]